MLDFNLPRNARVIRDLKIRRRRMSATAVMTEGDWEDVAVARRENYP